MQIDQFDIAKYNLFYTDWHRKYNSIFFEISKFSEFKIMSHLKNYLIFFKNGIQYTILFPEY